MVWVKSMLLPRASRSPPPAELRFVSWSNIRTRQLGSSWAKSSWKKHSGSPVNTLRPQTGSSAHGTRLQLVQQECPERRVLWTCGARSQLFRCTYLLLLVCTTNAGTATVAVQFVPELAACVHTYMGLCPLDVRVCAHVCARVIYHFCVIHQK